MGSNRSRFGRRGENDRDDAGNQFAGDGWQSEWDEGFLDDAEEWLEAPARHGRALIGHRAGDLGAGRQPFVTVPLIVPGDGVSMGAPFIKRRERPLMMRLTVFALIATILVTGIFAVTPLGSSANSSVSAFQAIAGSVVWQKNAGYFFYTARPGDDADSLAKRFHVQIGGIYELNGLILGQELAIGTPYKIPTDPNYGATFRPSAFVITSTTAGGNVFGSNWWNSVSGTPDSESPCAPDGHGNPLGYQLHSPNWGSQWVRGFTWYHNGDDIKAPDGNSIHAAQSGQVIWAGYDATNGLGWSIKLNNCNHISTLYGHMQQILVKAGDFVLMGDPIGLEGSTGWSTGPHLHFMVEWDNNPVDPFAYFGYNIYPLTHYVA
jgi:murein DD-endopeptidase MepM/ murein hydrolase activator NlpD